jgi:hypothetical protein
LLRADFVDPADQLAQAAGKPVYLGIAMDADQRLVLKPQNLLLNLPLARPLVRLPFDASGHDGSDRVH